MKVDKKGGNEWDMDKVGKEREKFSLKIHDKTKCQIFDLGNIYGLTIYNKLKWNIPKTCNEKHGFWVVVIGS